MKKVFALSLCLLMLVGAVAGCAKNDPAPSTTDPAPSTTDPKPSTPQTPDVPTPTGDSYKAHVIFGTDTKTFSVDPHFADNLHHNILFKLTHDRLVNYNFDTQKTEPMLATDWKLEDDNKTWVFTLRDDVKFHNGETLTADDVVFSFERCTSVPDIYSTVKTLWDKVEKCEARDEKTVAMTLINPHMEWLTMLSATSGSIVNRKAVEADPDTGGSIGTGGWKVEKWDGDFNEYVRNDDYWGEPLKTEKLTLRYIPEASSRLIALQNGEIDICQTPSINDLDLVEDDDKLDLIAYDSVSINYFAFNVDKAPGSDLNFRKAVAHAMNIQEYIDGALNGRAVRCYGHYGRHQFGYVNVGEYEYDLDLAKQYLAESGYPDGVDLSIMTVASRVTIAQIMQSQLKAINVNVSIDEVDGPGATSRSNAGEHQSILYSMTFLPAADDARRGLTRGSAANKAFWSTDRVEELFDLAVTEPDEGKRLDYYKEIQEISYDSYANVPLYYPTTYVAVRNGVGGGIWEPTGKFDLTQIYCVEE